VVIGKNVWIGANSVILPGVKIGNNSIIGAGSTVTEDVPPLSVAVGNPAKIIRQYEHTTNQWKRDRKSQKEVTGKLPLLTQV